MTDRPEAMTVAFDPEAIVRDNDIDVLCELVRQLAHYLLRKGGETGCGTLIAFRTCSDARHIHMSVEIAKGDDLHPLLDWPIPIVPAEELIGLLSGVVGRAKAGDLFEAAGSC